MRLTASKHALIPATLARVGLIALLAIGPQAVGDSTPGDLDDIRRTLETVEQDIQRHGERRDKTSRDIDAIEKDINNTISRQRDVSAEMDNVEQEIADLNEESAAARADLNLNADAVRALIRNVHVRGQTPELKILLGDADPVRMGRSLVWYRYVANARTDAIDGVRERINRLREVQATKSAREKKLAELTKRLDEDATYLDQRKRNKSTLLVSIDTNIQSKESRADSLREAESLLLREIEAIAAKARLREQKTREKAERAARKARNDSEKTPPEKARAPFVPVPGGNGFANRRGALPFPVDGEIGARFGQRKSAENPQTWKGILIHAAEGNPVRAVADGVVEATSNRPPFGPTLYLVHDGGFVTAYMHNSELVKERGDRVAAGEIIAYVGSSGLDRPGLFFLIRNANVGYVDPLKWLKTP